MLTFNDFLMILDEYRKAIRLYSDKMVISIVAITDMSLSLDISINTKTSAGLEVNIPLTISINDDGNVEVEIPEGRYTTRAIEAIDYYVAVMVNRVNEAVNAIEEAKREVLGGE